MSHAAKVGVRRSSKPRARQAEAASKRGRFCLSAAVIKDKMIQKLLKHLPISNLVTLTLFAVFPNWQTSLIVACAFAYAAFEIYMQDQKESELKALKDEMKLIKSQVEAIHIQRAMHR